MRVLRVVCVVTPGSNILMHRGNLRITDFGFMTTVENAALYQSCEIITLWYRPPELLLGTTKYGQEVDMWSAGYVVAILLPLPPPLGVPPSRDRAAHASLILVRRSHRCIFFELLTMEIAFRGRSSKDQLVLLFKTLGKPSEVCSQGHFSISCAVSRVVSCLTCGIVQLCV